MAEGGAPHSQRGLEAAVESIAGLIGRRLVGVGLIEDIVELIYDDCSVVRFSVSRGGLEIGELEPGECACLRNCMERHELGSEEMGDCMENCLEAEEG